MADSPDSSRTKVLFDFGDEKVLWWLLPYADEINGHLVCLSRADFIATHWGATTQGFRDFDSVAKELIGLVSGYESYRRAQAVQNVQRDFARIGRNAS